MGIGMCVIVILGVICMIVAGFLLQDDCAPVLFGIVGAMLIGVFFCIPITLIERIFAVVITTSMIGAIEWCIFERFKKAVFCGIVALVAAFVYLALTF